MSKKMERYLTLAEVQKIHPVSRGTRWRMVRNGTFPAPVRLSPGRVGWRESDIVRWCEQRR
jgi:prophage regulatory protein